MSVAAIELRDITSLEACRAVVGIQESVWGRDGETVPASVLYVSMKRGGILIGAYRVEGSGPLLVGFVWSLRGVRDGLATHWSHMLGVSPDWRHQGLAERLKWAQRQRALVAGVDLIEWTFDPLQAPNAHFNLHVLGAIGAGYAENVYGSLAGPLHRGTPTDRLTVEWWIGEPHVAGRLSRRKTADSRLTVRTPGVLDAPDAIQTTVRGAWTHVSAANADLTAPRIRVSIPPMFSEMQREETEIALAWRHATRDVMTSLVARGYRAVDFQLNREAGGGAYVFESK
jgi:predicted GNAT superfamily acetyltransferase